MKHTHLDRWTCASSKWMIQSGVEAAAQADTVGRPAGAAQMTPLGRTSKSRPVGATRIAPPGQSLKKELVGTRRSAPPAKRR